MLVWNLILGIRRGKGQGRGVVDELVGQGLRRGRRW